MIGPEASPKGNLWELLSRADYSTVLVPYEYIYPLQYEYSYNSRTVQTATHYCTVLVQYSTETQVRYRTRIPGLLVRYCPVTRAPRP